MSTTLDARLAALKPTETVTTIDGRRYAVVALFAQWVILWDAEDNEPFRVTVNNIRWPDPPRAKPGVVYRHKDAQAALPLGRCETCREWQPIASAPDGRDEVMLAWPSGMVRSGHRDEHWSGGPCWTTSSGMYFGDGPEWWAPMPAPPAAGEETRDGK